MTRDRLKRDRTTDTVLTVAFVLVFSLIFGGLFLALMARLRGWV
jgi:preprotein translocase subunit SecE